jgi:hypothetical protein
MFKSVKTAILFPEGYAIRIGIAMSGNNHLTGQSFQHDDRY